MFMKKLSGLLFVCTLLLLSPVQAAKPDKVAKAKGQDAILVTNRGSGDLSVINTRSLQETRVNLSVNGETVEPVYVNHWRSGHERRIFVGDRANDRVIALNDKFQVIGTTPVGQGVFHQWVQPKGHQLWVVGDIDNTVSVVNPLTLQEMHRINIPESLVAQGGRPHDVFVSRWFAFVTVVDLANGGSKVLRYNTWDYQLSGELDVGGDAHLFMQRNRLYVPSQDDSKLRIFNAHTLKLQRTLAIPNAHGITSNKRTRQVYITNIAEGGINAVWAVSKNGRKIFGAGDTSFPTPHNVALDARAKQIFVTHSGANNTVSVMATRKRSGPLLRDTVTVGDNPFGIILVERILNSKHGKNNGKGRGKAPKGQN